MTPKYNKELQRWGIWIDVEKVWLVNVSKGNKPVTFQSQQEAQKQIDAWRTAK